MGSRVVEKERESSASFQLVRVTGGYRSLGKLDFLFTLSLSFIEPSLPPCQQALGWLLDQVGGLLVCLTFEVGWD